MQDVTIYLRGGQSITVRAEDFTWRRGPLTGGLQSIEITYPDPVGDMHQLNWVRLEAVDAIESRPVRDPELHGDT